MPCNKAKVSPFKRYNRPNEARLGECNQGAPRLDQI